MSGCLILQNKECLVIGADSAISFVCQNGEIKRLKEETEKLFIIKDKIIFGSGTRSTIYKIVEEFKKIDKNDSETLAKIVKNNTLPGEEIEILLMGYSKNYSTISQIASYNDFEINNIINKSMTNCNIIAAGFHTDKLVSKAREVFVINKDAVKIMRESFDSASCTEIGGNLSIFYLDKYNVKAIGTYPIKDNGNINRLDEGDFFDILCEAVKSSQRYILGEKISITSKDGDFYIGSGDFKDGNIPSGMSQDEFGLLVSDQKQNRRIFIGLQQDEHGIQNAVFELRDKSGNKLLISDQGIQLKDQIHCVDNVAKNYPILIPFKIDDGVREIRKAIISLYFQKYRAYSKGTSAAGKTVKPIILKSGGTYYQKDVKTSSAQHDKYGGYVQQTIYTMEGEPMFDHNGVEMPLDVTNHRHFGVVNGEHYHETEIKINIKEHGHDVEDINIEEHEHDIKYDIYEDSLPSNVSVFVNGVKVKEGINNDIELDITKYMSLNKMNEVKIYSETRGRLVTNLFCSNFSSW